MGGKLRDGAWAVVAVVTATLGPRIVESGAGRRWLWSFDDGAGPLLVDVSTGSGPED
jgi:hypothetical protein